MRHDEADKEVYVSGVFRGLDAFVNVKTTMAAFGLNPCLFYAWVHERPEWEQRLARARETQAHALVEEALTVARDEDLDAKARRVIVDTNLKVAALYFPQRYSQAALDRLVAPEVVPEVLAPEQIAARIMRALEVASRGQLPAPAEHIEDADFDDA